MTQPDLSPIHLAISELQTAAIKIDLAAGPEEIFKSAGYALCAIETAVARLGMFITTDDEPCSSDRATIDIVNHPPTAAEVAVAIEQMQRRSAATEGQCGKRRCCGENENAAGVGDFAEYGSLAERVRVTAEHSHSLNRSGR